MKKITLVIFVLALGGCASNSYVYHIEPTQLKSNKTKYHINSVAVSLEQGHGAIPGDKSFATQTQLKKQFENSLIVHMKEKEIYTSTIDNQGVSVDVIINYKRTFNYGGKSLNKPSVSHSVMVSDNKKQKLASFSQGVYTTNFGSFKDVAVNLEISAFSWDAEDEP